MLNLPRRVVRFLSLAPVLVLFAAGLAAQQTTGILRGTVTDESGALIPAASLVVTGPGGARRNVQSQADGTFSVVGLAPGNYTVRLALPGFSPFEAAVEITAGKTQQLNIPLHVQAEKQEVTVKGEPGPQVSVEPDNNAGALVLRGADLDALSDDPDDLAADLQALAGPSAGPNGGQIFIDGFSGGSLPPKENIREIRINQNPFSAEFDQLGYGRIEVLTKPGTDKFHGSAFYYGGNDIFNARYPFAPSKGDYMSKMYGGLFTGPLTRKSSFTFDVEKRDINDDATVNAQILDPNFNPTPFSQVVPTPNTRTSVGPRFDYALTPNNTLVARYTYLRSGADNTGVGTFNLASKGYNTHMDEQRLQVTETSILNPKVVNETRLQFLHVATSSTGDNSLPAIVVNEAFMGGGAQIGHTSDVDNRWEIQNYTTTTMRTHTVRFGARVRPETQRNTSPNNFSGTFSYGGGIAPILDANNQPVGDAGACVNVPANALPGGCQQISSLERYRRTQIFNNAGLSVAQMRLLGGGPTLFTIQGGNPLASVSQTDVGAFIQDDWRVKPNLTVSLGLRYEAQTNIHDWSDVAPRIGIAWAPGARGGKAAKTVFRGGSGFFYSRFDNSYTLNAFRFNGITQQSYNVVNPAFLAAPPLATLASNLVPSSRTIVDANLRAPLIWQSTISVERQLPKNSTIASTFVFSRGSHMLMSRDINAPITPNGPRPYGNVGEIFDYESAGVFRQKQWMTNIRTQVNRKISLFGYYTLNYANSNTDNVTSFPANQYDIASEYGRSSLDRRHRGFIGGSVTAPLALRFSPYISINSGMPFNITTGRDFYGDTKYTDRPSLTTAGQPGAIVTQWGVFNPNPGPNDPRIPRNYGEAPGYFTINLRVSRTFGFGPARNNARSSAASGGDSGYGGPGGPGDRGPGGDRGSRGGGGRGPGGGPGGPGGSRGGGGRGPGGGGFGFGDSGSTEHRYNITISANAHNLLNHFNPGLPIGNLTSPLFGISNTTASFGSFGGSQSQAYNRHMELSLRFSF